MATKLTWLGHGTWALDIGGTKVVLDPFLDDSPTAPIKASEVEADYILVSHGHFDHVADLVAVARNTGAQVIANFEITQWLANKHNIENSLGMNLGGRITLPFGTIQMTIAWHSSQLPDGSDGGAAGGFLLTVDDGTVYFPCDTALFSDMKRIAGGVSLAVLPIGDLYTMGPEDALEAARMLQAEHVIPNHYNTWPPIEQDAEEWADRVRRETLSHAMVLQPGESTSL